MRYRTFNRKVRARRLRFMGTGECKCHRCKAQGARPAWRPEDYEPDWDGPVNPARRFV